MEGLQKVLADENRHLARSRSMLGATFRLIESAQGLYRFIGEMLNAVLPPEDHYEATVAIATCSLACWSRLVTSVLALLRGHTSEAIAATRTAIESAAFAARIGKHPHLAKTWIEAGRSDNNYAVYREKFQPGRKLFPKDDSFLHELGSRFDLCSKLSHPSVYSIGGQATMKFEEGHPIVSFSFFDLHSNDPVEPAQTLLWVIDTHYGVVKVILRALENYRRYDAKARDEVLAKFQAHLDYEKSRWHDKILATRTQNPMDDGSLDD